MSLYCKLDLTYLPVQRQQDGHTYGLFAVAFAAEVVVAGKSLVGASFIALKFRNLHHFRKPTWTCNVDFYER